MNPDIEVHSLACPAIVPLIEEGFTDTEIMDLTVRHYMDNFVSQTGIQDLILGCTHYPLIVGHIRNHYPDIRLYSSSAEVISEAAEMLRDRDMLASGSELSDRYYASDLSENFIAMTDLLFAGTDFRVKLKSLED
jgi:glutamate racemase